MTSPLFLSSAVRTSGLYFLFSSTGQLTDVGCTNDTAQNTLVAPDGTQFPCSNTTLQPDFTNELSTCQEQKANLTSGVWNVVIISNNGACSPLAAQRSFTITAGPQSTVTFTPTITLTTTTTPITTTTTTATVTATQANKRAAPPRNITSPSTTTATITQTVLHTKLSVPSHSLITSSPTCSVPPRCSTADPIASILPSVLPHGVQALLHDVFALLPRTAAAPIAAGLQLAKRAPDAPTVTVTDTNTSDYKTSTSVVTAPIVTSYVQATTTVTAKCASEIGRMTAAETVTLCSFSTTVVVVVPTVTVGLASVGGGRCRQKGGWWV